MAFYRSIGFKEDAVSSLGKRLEMDEPEPASAEKRSSATREEGPQ
jgi:hypothetical protein